MSFRSCPNKLCFNFYDLFLYLKMFPYMSVYHIHSWCSQSQKRPLVPLKVEVQLPLHAGNQSWVLYKSNKFPWSLSQLSSFKILVFMTWKSLKPSVVGKYISCFLFSYYIYWITDRFYMSADRKKMEWQFAETLRICHRHTLSSCGQRSNFILFCF